jgi:hypothetical protein
MSAPFEKTDAKEALYSALEAAVRTSAAQTAATVADQDRDVNGSLERVHEVPKHGA